MSVTPALLLIGGGFFLPIFITGQQIERWEGALFFGYYIVYAFVSQGASLDKPVLTSFDEQQKTPIWHAQRAEKYPRWRAGIDTAPGDMAGC